VGSSRKGNAVYVMTESDVPAVLRWEARTGGTWDERELRRQLRKPDVLGWVYLDGKGRVAGFMVYHSGMFRITILNLAGTNQARGELMVYAELRRTPRGAWLDGDAYTPRELVIGNLFGVAS